MKWLFYTLIAILFIWYLLRPFYKEGFYNGEGYPIDYYVITMNSEQRLSNIADQQAKLTVPIQKIDAVVGANVDIEDLVKKNVIAPEFANTSKRRRGEIGLYLSNLKTYNIIKEKGNPNGYSVILEDDFEIIDDDFENKIQAALETLQSVDFDMLYLQNNSNEYNKDATIEKNHGVLIKDNIYYFDKNNYLFGTVGILINNKNIDRILDATKYMDQQIDQKIQFAGIYDKLKLTMMYPNIIDQRENMVSIIGN